jgi:hypothetical protein
MHCMRRIVYVLVAVCLTASCTAKSPLDPSGRSALDRVELQFGDTYGSVVQLQNGTPTFYSVSNTGSVRVIVYTVDKDGVYQNVTRQATLSSSNLAVARPTSDSFSSWFALTGGNGQVTITATHSGMSSSLTFVASTAARPSPAVGSNMSTIGVGDDVANFATWVDIPGGFGVTSLRPGDVQWSSSDPHVVSVSGSTLHANAPGTADIALRYNNLETIYRVTIPPYARLELVR